MFQKKHLYCNLDVRSSALPSPCRKEPARGSPDSTTQREANLIISRDISMFTSALQIIKSAVADRRGVTAMEYGLIAGVLAVGLATAFTALSGRLTTAFNALNF